MYVTTCPETFKTFPLSPKTIPDSEQPQKRRGLNCEELRERYTGPPRGTVKELGYPCPKDMDKCVDLDPFCVCVKDFIMTGE